MGSRILRNLCDYKIHFSSCFFFRKSSYVNVIIVCIHLFTHLQNIIHEFDEKPAKENNVNDLVKLIHMMNKFSNETADL